MKRTLTDRLIHDVGKGLVQTVTGGTKLNLLDWANAMLPHYLAKDCSKLHTFLATTFNQLRTVRGKKWNIVAPRGNAKSTWMSLIKPLRSALEGEEPYIIIISDTGDQAVQHLDNIKAEIESNPRIARAYPTVAGKGPQWRTERIELKNGVLIEALGTGKKIRGRRHGTKRPSLIIIDDPQNDENIVSASQRNKDWEWLNKAVLKAGTKESNVLVAGTSLHRDCLVMRLQGQPGWRSRIFRSIMKWPSEMGLWAQWEEIYCHPTDPDREKKAQAFYRKNKTKMHKGANVLWPAEEDLLMLMQMRAEGHTAFEAEKQGNPINPENCEWPETYFDDHIWFDDWPKPDYFEVKCSALDPSKGKDAKHGDFSAIVHLARGKDGNLYVECDQQRRPAEQIIVDSVEHCMNFNPEVFGVEENAAQYLFGTQIEEESKKHGFIAPVSLINNSVRKDIRIRRLGKYLARKNIRFKRGSPGTLLLVNQLKDFPNGDHDDGPDAAEMALRLAIWLFNAKAGVGDNLGSVLNLG